MTAARPKLTDEEKAARKAKREEAERLRQAEMTERNKLAAEVNKLEAAKAAAKAAEAEKNRWLPYTLTIISRGVVNPPIWCEHHTRAKNWAAIVSPDPLAPGGLKRFWWTHGRGFAKYVAPESLAIGDIVEFGADYVKYSGWKEPERWLGVVTEMSAMAVVLQPCRGVVDAVEVQRDKRSGKKAL